MELFNNRACRRCGVMGIPFINECVECLDKARARYEGTYGYLGEDDDDCHGLGGRVENRHSRWARRVKVRPPSNKIVLLNTEDRHVGGASVLDAIDRALSEPSVRYGGVQSLLQRREAVLQSSGAVQLEPRAQKVAC